MSLNKDSLTEIISGKYGFSKKRSMELIEDILEIIKQRLARGENVLISGFGKFSIVDKRERRGRNPATGCITHASAVHMRPHEIPLHRQRAPIPRHLADPVLSLMVMRGPAA